MERFRSALGQGAKWHEAIEQLLAGLGEIPGSANVGFVYITDTFGNDVKSILNTLKQRTGIQHWVGTIGMAICHDAQEIYETPSIVAMIAFFPEEQFRLFTANPGELSNFRHDLEDWYSKEQAVFGVVHGDPHHSVDTLIKDTAQMMPNAFFVGGLTSSDTTYTQIAGDTNEAGLSGILFSHEIPLATSLSQGCSPIGDVHTISQYEKNILIKIDNKPALDIFKQDIGEILSRDLQRIAGYIFAAFPIKGNDTGDYTVRNIMGIDPENKLIAIGDMLKDDQQIMFCRRDANTAIEDLERMLARIKKQVGNKTIKGALYFSCLGRGRHLFGENSEELHAIQQALGNVPLVGFFANGEISYDRLYGYTGVLTVFL